MIEEGKLAPDFALPDQQGETHTLSDYKGKNVVVFFYPKDNTPGCTKEACSFRDEYARLQEKNLVVLGISADSESSHKKFADKYHLPFTLLSDPKREVIKKWGVWGNKSMFGKMFMGILRVTVIIDKDGMVKKIFRKIKNLDQHAIQILEFFNDDSQN